MVHSACVRLPLTLGGLSGIILHGEGAGGSWIMLSCAYQQTKAEMRSIKQRIDRNMEVLTKVERRRCHVPEKDKVGANVVGDDEH